MLPASTLFVLLYSRMDNLFAGNRRGLWYATASPFFVFFVIFGTLIYPMRETLHPADVSSLSLLGWSPSGGGMDFVKSLMQHWTFALFYVVAEVYSSVSISILFWQFANDVVPVTMSARFYPLFGQVSSLAPIVSGEYVRLFAAADGIDMDTSIWRVTAAVAVCGAAMMLLHHLYMTLAAAEAAREDRGSKGQAGSDKQKSKKPKPKLGMWESIRFLVRSRYLGYLAVLVLSYGLSIQFTDIVWKSMVKRLHPDAISYQRYFAQFSGRVGATTIVVIFFGSNIVKSKALGWRGGALLTPLIMGVLAAPFFWLILSGAAELSQGHLATVVAIGAVQSMLSKATKNALFDPTTQMAYIPLDEDSKVKGKAAIDVLGSRFGKSGGALLQQALVMHFGSIVQASPMVALLFYLVLGSWLMAVSNLATLFNEKTKAQQEAAAKKDE